MGGVSSEWEWKVGGVRSHINTTHARPTSLHSIDVKDYIVFHIVHFESYENMITVMLQIFACIYNILCLLLF